MLKRLSVTAGLAFCSSSSKISGCRSGSAGALSCLGVLASGTGTGQLGARGELARGVQLSPFSLPALPAKPPDGPEDAMSSDKAPKEC
jgi:hypothetical protein